MSAVASVSDTFKVSLIVDKDEFGYKESYTGTGIQAIDERGTSIASIWSEFRWQLTLDLWVSFTLEISLPED